MHSARYRLCTAEAGQRGEHARLSGSAPQDVTLRADSVDRWTRLMLERLRRQPMGAMAGIAHGHHHGTRQVPQRRRIHVPGATLAHRHTRSHTLQPDRWLRAPCRSRLSATAYQLAFDACNAAWLGCSVLATGSSPSTPCAPSRCSGAAESSLGDVRPHLQVDPSSCGFMVELDRLSTGL